MLRRLPLSLWLLVTASLSPIAASAAPSPDLSRMILTDKQAILVAPAETVASWNVDRAAWSPSGQFVLASRAYLKLPPIPTAPPDFQQTLVLWDTEQRKATELWKAVINSDRPPRFDWLPSGDVAFAVAKYRPTRATGQPAPQPGEAARQWVLRIDARRNSMKPLFTLAEEAELFVSRHDPVAVVFSQSERSLRILRSDGTVIRQVPFPAELSFALPRWSSDGARFLITQFVAPEGDKGQRALTSAADYALDIRTGQLSKLAARETAREETPTQAAGDLRLKRSNATVQEGGSRASISPLWLESSAKGPESRVLIAPDAEWAEISPRGDAVLYLAGGNASVASLVTLPKELFIQAREAALRMVALSNGKQLGLAAIIYAQKHGDRLPGADEPVAALLREVVNADSLYEGFVYTFPGGNLAEVAEPSKTLLGYVTGPGGRAEIFADGHVTWKKDE
jgi:hypothetical protein